jgi:hypothetical protein
MSDRPARAHRSSDDCSVILLSAGVPNNEIVNSSADASVPESLNTQIVIEESARDNGHPPAKACPNKGTSDPCCLT